MGTKYCTYRVGGPIDESYFPTTSVEAASIFKKIDGPVTVLGGGANTIIASRGIRGITVLTKRLMFAEPTFELGAGMPLARVATLAQDHGLSGAEFMIGVPGTLGGAIAMNAGAMGQETANIIDFVWLYNLKSNDMEKWPKAKLDFAYRKSAIRPQEMIVLSAQLTFQPGEAAAIADLMQKSLKFRQQHHPKEPNGGSVFQNPMPDQPAGRLLDELGAKGWTEGGAMVSPRHANFIVNTGHATSTDILKLMLRMKQAIKARYGYDVHPENRFVGEATEEEQEIWSQLN